MLKSLQPSVEEEKNYDVDQENETPKDNIVRNI